MYIPILTTRRPGFGGKRDQKWLFGLSINLMDNGADNGFDILEL